MPKEDDKQAKTATAEPTPDEAPVETPAEGSAFEAAPEQPVKPHPDGPGFFFPLIGIIHAEDYAAAVKKAEPLIKKAQKKRLDNTQPLPEEADNSEEKS